MHPKRKLRALITAVAAITALSASSTAAATTHSAGHHPSPPLLVSGLQGSVGSTVGPDGALYVVEGVAGKVTRVDPRTGTLSTFASGLPQRIVGLGGAMDIAFIHHTAYVLVTLVSPDVGGTSIDGIYRVDSPTHFTVVADLGAWSLAHPPGTAFVVPTGVQFALQPYGGGFLVTDGHHNRVLQVTLEGAVSERITLTNVVPTGLAVRGRTVLVALAGPVPHLPQDGKVVRFRPRSSDVVEVASGAPLLVDVEFGRGHDLYALSQGHFTPGQDAGAPADPNTGTLERVNRDGTMTPIATGLDQPSSLAIIGSTAYVVTLSGKVLTIRLQPAHRHH